MRLEHLRLLRKSSEVWVFLTSQERQRCHMLVTAGRKSASSSYRHDRGIGSFNVTQTATAIEFTMYVGEIGRDGWQREDPRQLQGSKDGTRVSCGELQCQAS